MTARSRLGGALWPWRVVAAALATLLWAAPTVAAPNCNLSTPGLAFGTHDYSAARTLDISTTLTLSCSCSAGDILQYRISLSAGRGTMDMRHMVSGAESLDFNLFIDAARTLAWGDGTAGSSSVAGGPLACNGGITLAHTVYGRVFAGARVVPGWYVEPSIIATLNWEGP